MSWVSRLVQVALVVAVTLSLQGCLFCELMPFSCGEPGKADAIVATPTVGVVATPARVDLLPGGASTTSVTLALSGGPTGAVLSLGGSLPSGVTASFSPAQVSGSGTSTLTLVADPTAAAGLFVFDVVATATGGSSTAVGTAQVTGEVLRPFRLSGVSAQAVTVGTSRDVALVLTRASGFNGPVSFAVLPSTVPAGTTATFAPAVTASSTTLLTLAIPPGATTGRYLTSVVATSGASADTATFLLDVVAAPVPPDFTLVAAPATVNVAPGGTATIALSLTVSQIGLGAITLATGALPAGVTAAFAPPSLTSGTAQLTLSTAPSTPDGSYPIVVTGTAATLVRQATVTLVVTTPASIALSVAPASLTVAPGASGQASVSIQRRGTPGAVALDVVGLPTGAVATANPSSTTSATSLLTLAVSAATTPGTYPLTVRGIAGALTATAPLTLVVPTPPTSSISVRLVTPTVTLASGGTAFIPVRLTRTGIAVGQRVELRVAGAPAGGAAWITPTFTAGDTATLQVLGGAVGTWPLVVSVALGAVPPTAAATITVVAATTPDFSLLPSPRELTITRGIFTPLALDVVRSAGFAGVVTFSAVTDNPGNYAVNFTPGSTAGGNTQVNIYASPLITPGPHVLVLRGTSGGITREALVTLHVQ